MAAIPTEEPQLVKQKNAAIAKQEAEAKVEAARKLLAEAETQLKANWKPGSKETLTFNIKRPLFGAVPRRNGKAWVGEVELTYDEFQECMAALSIRAEHEAKQRFGYHEGERYIHLQGGQGKEISLLY